MNLGIYYKEESLSFSLLTLLNSFMEYFQIKVKQKARIYHKTVKRYAGGC